MDLKPKKLNRMPDSKCIWLRKAYWVQAGHRTMYCNMCELDQYGKHTKCCEGGCKSYQEDEADNE